MRAYLGSGTGHLTSNPLVVPILQMWRLRQGTLACWRSGSPPAGLTLNLLLRPQCRTASPEEGAVAVTAGELPPPPHAKTSPDTSGLLQSPKDLTWPSLCPRRPLYLEYLPLLCLMGQLLSVLQEPGRMSLFDFCDPPQSWTGS